jgi:hypothetical protein
MHLLGRSLFWISTVGFVGSCFIGFCFLACLFAVRAKLRSFRVQDVTLWGKPSGAEPAARYARGLMRCLLAAAAFWCVGLVSGLSTGILH